MPDLKMWALNIYAFLGLALVLIPVGLLLLGVWVGMRCVLWRTAQLRARRKYFDHTLRADGARYPAAMGGVCEQCGRVSRAIFHPQDGPALCSSCYEQYWPTK